MSSCLRRLWPFALASIALAPTPCRAQLDSGARAGHAWYGVLGGLALAAVSDARLSAFARTHQSSRLDRAADALDPFGRAGILVPALAASVVVPRLAGRRKLSDAALRVALTYAAADGVESILKPLVGRHRPADAGGPWRFHPLGTTAEWHSFPSAHTVHAFALATALGREARTPWVTVPAYGIAALVGAQRVYTGEHWASDVVGSAALAIALGRATERALGRTPWLGGY